MTRRHYLDGNRHFRPINEKERLSVEPHAQGNKIELRLSLSRTVGEYSVVCGWTESEGLLEKGSMSGDPASLNCYVRIAVHYFA